VMMGELNGCRRRRRGVDVENRWGNKGCWRRWICVFGVCGLINAC
jgi:hypothetical protein